VIIRLGTRRVRMNFEVVQALKQLEKERGIPKDAVIEALEAALVSAFKRNYGTSQNVKVQIHSETGQISVFAYKSVVEEPSDPRLEISLDEARKVNPEHQAGDVFEVEITPSEFGRIAAQTAKQVVVQKIREAERGIIYEEFSNREGEVVTGIVQRRDDRNVIVDLGRVEAVMPLSEQVYREPYSYGDRLKGKKGQRYNERLFDTSGWVSNEDGTYRYKLFEEEYMGKDKNGKKEARTRKVLLYWSKTEADMARRKREEKLEKAARSVRNNAYSIRKGVDEYTKEDVVDKETGEVLENTKKLRSVDLKKAEKDALYDGYSCIITSELDYDERTMRKVYGGLWRIEQSFRIMKTDLYARPVFVSTNEHIRAHFLICFVSLLIIRIIQHRMGGKALSAERIGRALGTATCKVLKGGIIHLDDVGGAIAFRKTRNKNGKLVDTLAFSDEDEIALDYKLIQDTFNTNCYNIYLRQEVFNKILKNIVLA
jgi:hypothetical protein